jgi:hypothetical protein
MGQCCMLKIQQWGDFIYFLTYKTRLLTMKCLLQLIFIWAKIPNLCQAEATLGILLHIFLGYLLNSMRSTLFLLELISFLIIIAHQAHVLTKCSVQRNCSKA